MDSLYSRYANALLSIAVEEDKVNFYREEIKMLRKVFKENEDLMHLLSSYFVMFEEKEKIVDTIYPTNQNIASFIKIVIKNRRVNELDKIFEEFVKRCNEVLNIKDGIVYSVDPLTSEQISHIEEGVSNKLKCKVELENSIDKKLLGGVKVIVEDKIFDGSIKNKLERLKESLIQGGK